MPSLRWSSLNPPLKPATSWLTFDPLAKTRLSITSVGFSSSAARAAQRYATGKSVDGELGSDVSHIYVAEPNLPPTHQHIRCDNV